MLQEEVNADTVDSLLSMAMKTNATQLQAFCEHYVRNQMDTNNGNDRRRRLHHNRNNPLYRRNYHLDYR
jgi:hypothetical protein